MELNKKELATLKSFDQDVEVLQKAIVILIGQVAPDVPAGKVIQITSSLKRLIEPEVLIKPKGSSSAL